MAYNATEALAQIEDENLRLAIGLNAMWLIVTGIGILLMQAGFLALEVGTVRAKNVKAALFKNVVDHAVGAIAWYCIGFSIFIGNNPFASGPNATWFNHDINEFPKLFQQYGFAVTSATIVSGAVLSRCRLRVYLGFSAMLSLYIYPIVAHWAWTPGGWLYDMGFEDFAGSSVVHTVGGICALAGAWACGPRVGRFGQAGDGGSEASKGHLLDRRGSEHASEHSFHGGAADTLYEPVPFRHKLVERLCCGNRCAYRFVDIITLNAYPGFRVREQPGHSAAMQCLGALLLFVAWFSFNSGSSGGVDTIEKTEHASRAAVNTMLAAASGTVFALMWSDLIKKTYDLDLVINGLLSALVAITAGCGYIDPWAAIAIGAISVLVYIFVANIILYGFHIDDPLNAVAVHAANGIVGTLWVGLADYKVGLFYGGGPRLLGVQAIGTVAITGWSFVNALIYFLGLKYVLPKLICREWAEDDTDSVKENSIVYSADAQLVGLDFFYFGGSGFPDFDVEAVSEYNATQRIKNKFNAKRIGSMRLFDHEVPESSTHGRGLDNSYHGGRRASASFHGAPSTTPTTTISRSNSFSAHPKSAASHQVATVGIDTKEFAVENPAPHRSNDD